MAMLGKDFELRDAVQNEVRPGEKILWVGKPNPVRMALKTVPQLLMGVLWLGFCIFFFSTWLGAFNFTPSAGDIERGVRAPSAIFGLFPFIFFGIGIWMLIAPLWQMFKGIRSIYAVTDQRLLTISRTPLGQSVISYGDEDITQVERRERGNGTGDLIFAKEQRSRSSRNSGRRTYWVDIGFFGIDNVRHVEELVLDTFKQNVSQPADSE
ncbi:MAG: hypothetical protein H7175_23095 [Burkholderiales bacterium]|nr:hypothetical protein [Anaerolineae bacterium]